MTEPALDELRLRRLIDVGRSLIAKLDVEAVLHQLLDVAREVTGARYAALGVFDDRRQELERFVTRGHRPRHASRRSGPCRAAAASSAC